MRDKEEEIIEVMKERKLTVLAMSDIRLQGCGDRKILEDYRLIYIGGQEARHGVGLVLNPELAPLVERVSQVNERIVCVDIKLQYAGISFIQVYAPQQGRPVEGHRPISSLRNARRISE